MTTKQMLLCVPHTATSHCRLERPSLEQEYEPQSLCPSSVNTRIKMSHQQTHEKTHTSGTGSEYGTKTKFVVVIKFRAFKPRLTIGKRSLGHGSTCRYWMYFIRVRAPDLKPNTLKAPATNKSYFSQASRQSEQVSN